MEYRKVRIFTDYDPVQQEWHAVFTVSGTRKAFSGDTQKEVEEKARQGIDEFLDSL